jgi:membrane associated rhomboid family serine protease
MWFFEFLQDVIETWMQWRFLLCFTISVIVALLGRIFLPDEGWVIVACALTIFIGVITGLVWQLRDS